MDFMKVVDQAVREIKREVNLKVLKIPEIEQKVLDATDDEPWGPHGSALAEIAQATKKFSECQMVMNVLWTRLTETGKNWRFVYKALAVVEYLVSHGSERAVDEIVEHTFQISSLASFEYTEPNGKDVGINVRKKAEMIVSLLNDKDKIQEVRNKAATNRENYVGLSSSGITYKSGSASSFSSNLRSGQYGGFGNRGDSETFKDSHKDKDHHGEQKYEKSVKPKKETSRYGSTEQNTRATSVESSTRTSNPEKYSSVPSLNALTNKYEEDADDFDPRGTSSKPSGSTQVDVFGKNLVDLLDEPVSISTDKQTSLDDNRSDVDLFADADFVSATPGLEVGKNVVPQKDIDLFASQPTPVVSTTMDFFAAPDPVPQPNANASGSDTSSNTFDPFASVPLNNFEGSDPFGSFASHTDSLSTKTDKPPPSNGRYEDINVSSSETKPTPKKDTFNVKSGIWADSLTRGLIDLNITAPKKVNLADVGIVGGLTDVDEKDKGTFPSFYMGGGAMGNGSGLGRSGFTSASPSLTDDFFSSLSRQQNQFGAFQK